MNQYNELTYVNNEISSNDNVITYKYNKTIKLSILETLLCVATKLNNPLR